MVRSRISLWTTLLVLLAGGCATPPDSGTMVRLETGARVVHTTKRMQTFNIVPGPRSQWGEAELNYKWIEANLIFALTARGYQMGSSSDDSDLLIILNPSSLATPSGKVAKGPRKKTVVPVVSNDGWPVAPAGPPMHYRFGLNVKAYDMVQYRAMSVKERNDGARLLWEVTSSVETESPIAENEVFARLVEVAAANIGTDSVPPVQVLSRDDFLAIRKPVSSYTAR